jgi:predicted RND superfamily exporter protein
MTPRFRRWLWLLALVPCLIGLLRLRFNVEILDLLPVSLPAVEGLKLYQENFSNARELIITLRADDADVAETAARALAGVLRAATNLTAEVTWQPPWLEHPGQAAELIGYLWLNQPPTAFDDLSRNLAPENVARILEQARQSLAVSLSPGEIALRGYDPYGLTRLPEQANPAMPSMESGQELFASADGTYRLLFVQARDELKDYRRCVAWLKSVQAVVEEWRNQEPSRRSIALQFTGRPAFVAEISSGMERDMTGPSAGTLAVIAILFYLSHRRWKPLAWLLTLLMLILVATLALGGLFLGTLNVVSLGFAAILLGLAEDFGIVLYQESRSHPELSAVEVRRAAAPGIFWSSVTTAGAFLLLNLSGLPGLAELGSLVAIGVVIAAVMMLYLYLPPLMRNTGKERETRAARDCGEPAGVEPHPALPGAHRGASRACTALAWSFTALLLAGGGLWLWLSPPRFDRSPDALRPKNSRAYAALDELKIRMNRPLEPQWVVIRGRDEREVAERLKRLEPILAQATRDGLIAGVTLPAQLWPQPDHQAANRATAARLAARWPELRDLAIAGGFTREALGFTEQILATWSRAAAAGGVFWPDNPNSHWILEKLTAHRPGEFLAIGLAHPVANPGPQAKAGILKLSDQLRREGALLSGWSLLGTSISQMVANELPRVVLPICLLIFVSLWLAFRSTRDVALSLATLLMSGLALGVVMNLLGWSWNMMNLMSVPLLLGMGVDFSIHIQLALRRHHGDLALVRDSIGRALLLAGTTTVAGFASLAFSSNAGMASLGKICGTGIVCSMLIAIYLLPVWWRWIGFPKSQAADGEDDCHR